MKNILISGISLFNQDRKNNAPLCDYDSEDHITVKAKQTNEACVKFILKKLKSCGSELDYYFRLQTNDVQGDDCTMDYLDDEIQEFCDEEGIHNPDKVNFCLGKYDEKENRYDRVLSEIADRIMQIYAVEDKSISIYIDVAGGKRNISIFIQLLTKLLSFYNFDVHAYYADFDRSKKKGTIVNTDLSFKHMEILDATYEFVRTGSATSLRELFKDSNVESVTKLLNVMEEFGDAVLLCSTDLADIVLRLTEQLNNLEKGEKTYLNNVEEEKNGSNNEEGLYIIKTMIPLIKNKMNIDTSNKSRAILSTVRWCLENNLIQQALTILNENALNIIFDSKMIEIDEDKFVKNVNIMKEKPIPGIGKNTIEKDVEQMRNSEDEYKKNNAKYYLVINKTFYNIHHNIYNRKKISSNELEMINKFKEETKNSNPISNFYNTYRQMITSILFRGDFIPIGVKVNIKLSLLSKILIDRLYISHVRNQVNHASNPKEKEAVIKIFKLSRDSFKSCREFNPSNLKIDLFNAVKNLSNALNYLQQKSN